MKLLINGIEIKSTEPVELLFTNKLGVDVKIIYAADCSFCKGQEHYEIFHNVTEVHNLYKSLQQDAKKVAFESDIHATGFNRDQFQLAKVEILNESETLWEKPYGELIINK